MFVCAQKNCFIEPALLSTNNKDENSITQSYLEACKYGIIFVYRSLILKIKGK